MESLQDRAYDTIYESIISLDLLPGQRVSDRDFEVQLEMSRTPIREAMLRLTRNGLLKSVPQSGTFITKINLGKTLDARYVRQTLERKVIGEVVSNHSNELVEDLELLIFEQRRAANRNELKSFFNFDDKFHESFYTASNHANIWHWLLTLSSDLNRFRSLRLADKNLSLSPLLQEHEELLAAVKNNDAEEADKVIQSHLDLQLIDKDEVTKQYPEYFE
ncbi:GntR family transcriptional regulator [Lentilactobacillus sp. Marseille-Q4993]|uniref:GntR family transcriptional regulator n=1 Tax=Lentilactobacillus sp. Marseille-Q4993 TaxID=3039492 RepID=UPI0024BBEEBB|nr:GntR family transcriptional regulator [Lentilactobacillus sp. Marseille-Q4993]